MAGVEGGARQQPARQQTRFPRSGLPPATGTPPVPMRPPRGPAGRRPGPVRCPPPGPSRRPAGGRARPVHHASGCVPPPGRAGAAGVAGAGSRKRRASRTGPGSVQRDPAAQRSTPTTSAATRAGSTAPAREPVGEGPDGGLLGVAREWGGVELPVHGAPGPGATAGLGEGHPVRRRVPRGHPPDVTAGEGGRQGVQPSVVRLQERRPERTGAPGGEARASVGVPVLPLPVPPGHPAGGQHGDLHAASARRLGPEGGRAGGVRRERQEPPVRMPYGSSPPPPVAPSAQENGEGGHVVLRHHGKFGDLLVRDGQAESGEAREQGGQRDARLDA